MYLIKDLGLNLWASPEGCMEEEALLFLPRGGGCYCGCHPAGVGCLVIVVALGYFCHPNMEPWQLTPYENSTKLSDEP